METSLHAQEDLTAFWHTRPAIHLVNFIRILNASVSGRLNSYIKLVAPSHHINTVSHLLTQLIELVMTIPVPEQASRFGHPIFRKWCSHMVELVDKFLDTVITDDLLQSAEALHRLYHTDDVSRVSLCAIKNEVKGYFLDSFGNRQRIDYGTGHELHFICFLYCLFRLDLFTLGDFNAVLMGDNVSLEDPLPLYQNFGDAPLIVLLIFRSYIDLMRHLQRAFWLEPAGSQGVWGLDDYHFLPFLFGSSQLIGHPILRPKSIHISDNLEAFSNEYIYFDAIKFIRDLKDPALRQQRIEMKQEELMKQLSSVISPLRWHSPLLDDISGAKNWQKVNQGLLKMYYQDVLHKLPIMQHFLVGHFFIPKLFDTAAAAGTETHPSHCHPSKHSLPDCCGIRLPSAMAAAATSCIPRKIPFD
jgi:serine/threonine-protein phosphatase 2A activator